MSKSVVWGLHRNRTYNVALQEPYFTIKTSKPFLKLVLDSNQRCAFAKRFCRPLPSFTRPTSHLCVEGEGLEPSYCKVHYDNLLKQIGFTDQRRYPSINSWSPLLSAVTRRVSCIECIVITKSCGGGRLIEETAYGFSDHRTTTTYSIPPKVLQMYVLFFLSQNLLTYFT